MHYRRILPSDPKGTLVTLGTTPYLFAPKWVDGPDLALVENEDHQLVFDRIPEGYARYKGPFPEGFGAVAAPTQTAPAKTAPAGPSMDELIAKAVAEALAKQAAEFAAQTPAPAAPEAPAQAEPTAPDAAKGDDLESKSPAELRAIFKDELERNASNNASPETMIAQIRAKREAKG